MLNPELKIGDRVTLINMVDENGMLPGLSGIVRKITVVMGQTEYGVLWDNGSTLALLSDFDTWMKERPRFKKKD